MPTRPVRDTRLTATQGSARGATKGHTARKAEEARPREPGEAGGADERGRGTRDAAGPGRKAARAKPAHGRQARQAGLGRRQDTAGKPLETATRGQDHSGTRRGRGGPTTPCPPTLCSAHCQAPARVQPSCPKGRRDSKRGCRVPNGQRAGTGNHTPGTSPKPAGRPPLRPSTLRPGPPAAPPTAAGG